MNLTVEQQVKYLRAYLGRENKRIVESPRDGQCLLKSFMMALENCGKNTTINTLKYELESYAVINSNFYKDFYEYENEEVDLGQQLWMYLDEPMRYYSLPAVDIFPDMLGKAMKAKVTLFNIDNTGKIWKVVQGLTEGYQYEVNLAKYSIAHIDAVLPEQDIAMSHLVETFDYQKATEILNAIWGKKSFVEKPLKGIRKNQMYTVNATIEEINCDDNGAYTGYRSNEKLYLVLKDIDGFAVEAKSLSKFKEDKSKLYYNERSGHKWIKHFVSSNDSNVYGLFRSYRHNLSIPDLKQTVIRIRQLSSKSYEDTACVVYRRNSNKGKIEEISDDEVEILPHKNAKKDDRPYIRTSKAMLDREDSLLRSSYSSLDTFDTVYEESGGAFRSNSQSGEPRNIQQIYRRKAKLANSGEIERQKKDSSTPDEVANLIEAQKTRQLIHSIVTVKNKYFIVLYNEKQIQDIVRFCTSQNPTVLAVDTTFKLCDLWLTDSCYRNKRLLNTTSQKHPVFLGPSFFHFTKDKETFMRFALELRAAHSGMSFLKRIGIDMDSAIFKGFKDIFPSLMSLICARHISGRDSLKLDKLLALVAEATKLKSKAEILKDIYGVRTDTIQEVGLTEAFDKDDFEARLNSLEEKWNKLCPRFHAWFKRKRSDMFVESVIQSAREGGDVVGMFYNNDIEAMHYVEKMEQAFKKKTVVEVIDSLQKIITRQTELEKMAIYGGGKYILVEPWKRIFGCTSSKWHHKMNTNEREKHYAAMIEYCPTMSDSFTKPRNCGRKPGDRMKSKTLPPAETIIDRQEEASTVPMVTLTDSDENVDVDCSLSATSTIRSGLDAASTSFASETIRFNDPRKKPAKVFELHFREKLHRKIEVCRGDCGVKIKPDDKGLLVKSYGVTRFTNKKTGQLESKHGPQYIHFSCDCLKRFDTETYYGPNERFDYSKVTVDKTVQSQCNDNERQFLKSLGIRFME